MLLPSSFLLLLIFTSASTWELKSPVVTNWGAWHEWAYCPDGTFAAGFQVKAEGYQRGGDDTGVNAVALYCRPFNWKGPNNQLRIMSGEGLYGDWGNIKWCPEGQILIGFRLLSEPSQGKGDDTATSNFGAFCGSPFHGRDENYWIEGDTMPWGDWTATQWCPEGRAICGIQTQIEGRQGGRGDDTSMNNVNAWCCEVNLDCVPDVKRVTLENYDNSKGPADISFEYTVTVSFTHTTMKTQTLTTSEKQIIANKITKELSISSSYLNARISSEFSDSIEKGSTNSIESMVQETVQTTYQKKLSTTIPAGMRVKIDQMYFTCGDYMMGVAKTINTQY